MGAGVGDCERCEGGHAAEVGCDNQAAEEGQVVRVVIVQPREGNAEEGDDVFLQRLEPAR